MSPQIGCSMCGFHKNVGVIKIILSELRGGHLKEFRSMFLVLVRLCSNSISCFLYMEEKMSLGTIVV